MTRVPGLSWHTLLPMLLDNIFDLLKSLDHKTFPENSKLLDIAFSLKRQANNNIPF